MTKYKEWLLSKKFDNQTDVLITTSKIDIQWHVPVIYVEDFMGMAVLRSPGIIQTKDSLERHKQRFFSV